MRNKHFVRSITFIFFLIMIGTAIALWRGSIPIDWLASLGYEGLFLISLINGVAPIAGPSQIATFFVASKLNPLFVGLASGFGGAIGELAGYAFGYSLRSGQSEYIERKIEYISNWKILRVSREHSFVPLFVLASVPNPFFDPVSAIAGSLRIGFMRYFIPVLFGKTVRHLAIAYAGYYSISMDISTLFSSQNLTQLLFIGIFLFAVMLIAFLVWLVRANAESDPDPFLLNITYFAFAGQCVLLAELLFEGRGVAIILPTVVSLVLVFLQLVILKQQFVVTKEHYKALLKKYYISSSATKITDEQSEYWSKVLIRITGIDFYPELYKKYQMGVKGGPREERRRQAISILPNGQFRKIDEDVTTTETGFTTEALTVPVENRQLLWKLYYFTCILTWISFIGSLIYSRLH
jgi:membrane protein YqaA with SNARE-associated domain